MNRQSQDQSGRGQQQGGDRRDKPPKQEKKRKVDEFKDLIRRKSFTDDEVMKLSDSLGKELSSYKNENTTTQIRKFYNLMRVAETQTQDKPDLAKLKLRTIQAQVAYAAGRETLGREFKSLFDASLKKIIESGDENINAEFKAFMTFFESLFAYFYFHAKRESSRRR